MRALRRLLRKMRNFAVGSEGQQRRLEEMEQHVAMQTEENMHAGMTPAEARREAMQRFGSLESVREQYHAEEGLPRLEVFLQDCRFAMKQVA
jgi:putative ABC transport system permease protein